SAAMPAGLPIIPAIEPAPPVPPGSGGGPLGSGGGLAPPPPDLPAPIWSRIALRAAGFVLGSFAIFRRSAGLNPLPLGRRPPPPSSGEAAPALDGARGGPRRPPPPPTPGGGRKAPA